jgi:hypothetical protein
VIDVRQSMRSSNGHNASPLADVGATSALYESIMQQPFEAIRSLVADPAVLAAPPERAFELRQRIHGLVQRLKETGGV